MENADYLNLDVLNTEDKDVLLVIIALIFLMEDVLLKDAKLLIKTEMDVLNVFLLIKKQVELADFQTV